MFTGIIEEVGKVSHVVAGSNSGEIKIKASKVLVNTKIGDSIAVNGVCLTVTSLASDGFTADVMPVTLRCTNLGQLKTGDSVDLERAMAADGRFGGHIVSGHIDDTGTIVEMKREENAVWVKIAASPEIIGRIIEKGSIAIDGISLTVAALHKDSFQVSIIPHTADETILLKKRVGDMVNLENDIVGKYVQRFLTNGFSNREEKNSLSNKAGTSSGITLEFLEKNGF